ncbi:hypothetical protein FACS189446_8820 [Bacteroidia bacterium]|nr:hypothetical protein FACS189446_8820 [Bacteroidia bacterium]
MRTNNFKKFAVFMLVAAMLSVFTAVSAQDDTLKKMEGTWKYSMPNMGGGENIDAVLTIKTVDGDTKVYMQTPMGEIISSPLKPADGKYVCDVKFDSEMGSFTLKLSFSFKGDKLLQEASSDFGDMPAIEMTRATE